ncbi:hypothetical protein ACR6C2_15050 [Streptomyces sp. INA 01156]
MKKRPFLWVLAVIVLVVGVRVAFMLQDAGATDEQLRSCREAIMEVRNDPAGDELMDVHLFRPDECGESISKDEYTSLVVETEPNTPYDSNPFNDDQPMKDR